MSLVPNINSHKRCFVYCGPHACDCTLSATTPKEVSDEFKKIMEEQRKKVRDKDKEHEYDRAMEVLEKQKKTAVGYQGQAEDKQDCGMIFGAFVPID